LFHAQVLCLQKINLPAGAYSDFLLRDATHRPCVSLNQLIEPEALPYPTKHEGIPFGTCRRPLRDRNAIIRLLRMNFLIGVHDRPLRYTSIGNPFWSGRVGNEDIFHQLGHYVHRVACSSERQRPESAGFPKPALAGDHAGDGSSAVCPSLRS